MKHTPSTTRLPALLESRSRYLYYLKVAREGRDKMFTFSFWCIFGANNFFSSKFSGKGVGAMPYLLINFWSRDSVYDGFLNI